MKLSENIAHDVARLAWGAATLATGVSVLANAARRAGVELHALQAPDTLGSVPGAEATLRALAPASGAAQFVAPLSPALAHAAHVEVMRPGRSFGLEVSVGAMIVGMGALSLHRAAYALASRDAAAATAPGAAQRRLFDWGSTACLAGARLGFLLCHGVDPADLSHHTFAYGAMSGVLDAVALATAAVGVATVLGLTAARGLMAAPNVATNQVAALLSAGVGLAWAGTMEALARPTIDPLHYHDWGPTMLLGSGTLAALVGVGVGLFGLRARRDAAPASGWGGPAAAALPGRVPSRVLIEEV